MWQIEFHYKIIYLQYLQLMLILSYLYNKFLFLIFTFYYLMYIPWRRKPLHVI